MTCSFEDFGMFRNDFGTGTRARTGNDEGPVHVFLASFDANAEGANYSSSVSYSSYRTFTTCHIMRLSQVRETNTCLCRGNYRRLRPLMNCKLK
jgi:hypothetical protein